MKEAGSKSMISVSQSKLNISKCPSRCLIWAITCMLVLMADLGPQVHAVSPAKESSRRKVIVLDPGHGGTDTGAVGPAGLTEKAVTLSIAKKIIDSHHGNIWIEDTIGKGSRFCMLLPLRQTSSS